MGALLELQHVLEEIRGLLTGHSWAARAISEVFFGSYTNTRKWAVWAILLLKWPIGSCSAGVETYDWPKLRE